MEAFEQLVSEFLWMEGCWVRNSVKIELTKGEKRLIGLPSCPRWELDIVAYNGRDNVLHVVECKNFADGVRASSFDGSNSKHAKRFKIFNKPKLRRVVFKRMCIQFWESRSCRKNPDVRLALACSKIRNEADRKVILAHSKK